MTEFIYNSANKTHKDKIIELLLESDEVIVASPFLSDDYEFIIDKSKNLQRITIITNLEKYDDTASKVISLYNFSNLCKEKNIDFILKNDGKLHGKVYFFFKAKAPAGVLVSSANFTKNGLVNNKEYGLFTTNKALQEQILYEVNSSDLIEVYDKDLNSMKEEAECFLRENKPIKKQRLDLSKYFSRKDIVNNSDLYQILLNKTCDSIESLGDGIAKEIKSRYISFKKKGTRNVFVNVTTDTKTIHINTYISKDNVIWEEGFTKDISPESGHTSYGGTLQFKIKDEFCLNKAMKYIMEEYRRLIP